MKIVAVGDISTADNTINGIGIGSISKKYGWDYLLDDVKDILSGDNILIGNLEGTLSSQAHSKNMRLCGLPTLGKYLKSLSFDVLSIANNHTFDYGPEVFKETVEVLKNSGIQVCGLRGINGYHCEPVILSKDDQRIGVLAYNWINVEEDAEANEYIANVSDGVVNYTWNRSPEKDLKNQQNAKLRNEVVFNDIRKLRSEVDTLIVMPHWGYEWGIYPPIGLVVEARSFVKAGVDIILGAHSHVMQGVERYQDGVVFYSMGNFLFDAPWKKFPLGMVVECCVSKSGEIEIDKRFVRRGSRFQTEKATEREAKLGQHLVNESSKAIISPEQSLLLNDEMIYKEYEKQYNLMKLYKLQFILRNMLSNPKMLPGVFQKITNALGVIGMRLLGKKVRW